MTFQLLEQNKECVAIYKDGKMYYNQIPSELDMSWKYSLLLNSKNVEYAYLYSEGKSLLEVCPQSLKERWITLSQKMNALKKTVQITKLSLEDNCFYLMIPEKFLLEYLEVKNKITEHVVSSYQKPVNYDFLVDLSEVIEDIKYRPLKLDFTSLLYNKHNPLINRYLQSIKKSKGIVDYKLFGTKTGRLSVQKNSFPILTLDKRYRDIIVPSNDVLVELDYNAAELRCMLALQGDRQPLEDIHAWVSEQVFNGVERSQSKLMVFQWFYDSSTDIQKINKKFGEYNFSPSCLSKLENLFKKTEIRKRFWDGKQITNPYGRIIESDFHHSMNFLIQSTFSDMFLRQKIKLFNFIKEMKSQILFSIHDCVVLDLAKEDKHHLQDMINCFSETDFGHFKVNVKAGKNFKAMKSIL